MPASGSGHEPPAGRCHRCGAGTAPVAVTGPGARSIRLCEACLVRTPELREPALRIDVARFFALLARPHGQRPPISVAGMPADAACPVCGLRYAEFAADGLAGCAGCYDAFEPAIRAALALLSDREPGSP